MKRVYTDEQRKFFEEFVPGHSGVEIVEEFNRRFNAQTSLKKVRAYMKNNGLKNGLQHHKVPKGESKVFQKEVTDFIIQNNYGKSAIEIMELVNNVFKTDYKINQIKAFRNNHKLISGISGQFTKGHVSANKGRKGYCPPGAEKGWFQKGHVPHNHLKLGTEIIDINGYHKIKIGEPNVWKFKHIIIWEKHNGKAPEGYNIIFADGNKDNCDISNLMCITKAENVIMNNQGLRSESVELTKTGLAIAKLKHRISEVQKENRKCQK